MWNIDLQTDGDEEKVHPKIQNIYCICHLTCSVTPSGMFAFSWL